jgi:protein TIF31
VLTLEGNKYCITGNSKSFYVNRSNGNILDPRPTKQALEASTLVGLLQKISAKFKKGFREVLDCRASAHPFENVQSLLPVTSWLGVYPVAGNFLSSQYILMLAVSLKTHTKE